MTKECAVNTYTGPDHQPTRADLEREFPGWVFWRWPDGQYCARRIGTPEGDHDALGEDPQDLREAITLALDIEQEKKAGALPAQPPTPASTDDPDDLADLDALAAELNRRDFPSLRLTPPGQSPHLDVTLPGSMAPGERIYAQADTYFWASTRPIGPTSQPAAAADIITEALRAARTWQP
jgi:hypothetical protein